MKNFLSLKSATTLIIALSITLNSFKALAETNEKENSTVFNPEIFSLS
jgi:hypothetical protein